MVTNSLSPPHHHPAQCPPPLSNGVRPEAREERECSPVKSHAVLISAKEVGKVAGRPLTGNEQRQSAARPLCEGGEELEEEDRRGREEGGGGGGRNSKHMAVRHMTHWRGEQSRSASSRSTNYSES